MGKIGRSYVRESYACLPSQNLEALRRLSGPLPELQDRARGYEIALAVGALFCGLAFVGWALSL